MNWKQLLSTLLVVGLMTFLSVTFAQTENTCEDICGHPDLNISYEECISLVTLYVANGGETWTHNTNRTTSPDVTTWWGVGLSTGSGVRHVNELVLPANGLIGPLTPGLQSLSFLTRLDIQSNAITTLPSAFQSMTQLEELIVAHNQLTELPDIFANRGALDLLRAEGNQLSTLPPSLGNLYELDLLDISNNQLTSLPASIGDLDDLDILKIANNQLTVLPNPISDLDQLSLLDAQGNNLTVWPTQIEQLVTLESLQLQDNMFTTVPAAVFELPNLHHLNLRNNAIDVLPDEWNGSSSLQIVDLGANRLSALPASFATLDGLLQLYLHENRLTGLAGEVMNISSLQLLHVGFNHLTGLLPTQLERLQSLTYLDVSYNKLEHTAQGDALIPESLTERVVRPGFVFQGEGQQSVGGSWLEIADQEPFPSLVSSTITRTLDIAPGVRMTLSNEQEPTVIVGGTGELCNQLIASLTLTESGTYELVLQPQSVGVYAGCTLQLADQWGELTSSREVPTITVVTETQESFCDDPILTIDRSACLSLLQLFVATDGINRDRSDGWFVHPRVEDRYGIETVAAETKREIVGIYLHSSNRLPGGSPIQGGGNGLRGTLPNIFGALPSLKTLALGNNKLTGTLPSSLQTLVHLEHLYLQNNTFTGPLDNTVSGLTALRRISVQQNKFSGPLVNAFTNLHALETIDLRDNSFSGLLPVFAADAPLFYLHAANNDFSGPLPTGRATYVTWQHLNLQGNTISGTIPTNRGTRASMKNLDISNNVLIRESNKSAVLDPSLINRWQGLTQKSRSNQRDIVAPSIELVGTWTATGTTAYTLDLAVSENNFAVDTLGAGMPVVIGGNTDCDALEATAVQVNTGIATIVVTPARAGIFENCTMTILDHGENYSNTIDLPILGYDLGEQSICLNPSLSIPLHECRALRDLYQATNGDEWINHNNRWQTPQVANRFGVQTNTIDGEGHVTALLLHRNELTSANDPQVPQSQGNNLQGVFPDSLRDLTHLKVFRVDDNTLSGTPRDALVGMNDLEVLTLAHNSFSDLLPVHRGGFTKLTTLDLSDNEFSGAIPVSWRGLHELSILRVGNNQLGGSIEVTSGDRGALELVDLSHNQFSGAVDADRSMQPNLQEFYAQENQFAGSLPASWATLTGITKVNLSNNKLTGPFPIALQSWTSLEEISLSGNAIFGDINSVFPTRSSIKKLDITGNKFTGRLDATWLQRSSLEELYASRNALDRTSDYNAIVSVAIQGWLDGREQYDLSSQNDITVPKMNSPTIVWSPVTNAQKIQLTREENSYAINQEGSGLLLQIGGGGPCLDVLLSTGWVYEQTGTLSLLVQPQLDGVHTCWLTLTDHAGNQGRLQITPFIYDASCGDGEILSPEQCDEGRFCDQETDIECTQDSSVCPFSCVTQMVDNCTPACKQSVCGDRFVDANGLDNIAGTQDDELCDVGSFCADGRDCTANPSICPGGATACKTRFTPSCSPVCAPSACGDGIVDDDGTNDVLDDADDEDCDDGNTIGGDGCSSSCKVEYCGDGFIDTNGIDQQAGTADDEECDLGPGNGLRAGQCNQFCKVNEQTCQWCFETCQGGTGHHSIYLLIDVSGSMEGNKMQKAKQGAIDFVQHIMSGAAVNSGFISKIGLIKFSSNGTIVQEPTTNYQQIINSIQTLQAGGSTNFGDPLNDAKTYFQTHDGGFEKHIVLLSDGLPTVGTQGMSAEEYSLSAADAVKAMGVHIYTIAVEQTEEGIEFMRKVSSASYVNLASGKSTTQSSTQSSRSSSRAVDADKNNYSQTKNNNEAWWEVDLESEHMVREVKVWNRTNLTNDTSNFWVMISPMPFVSEDLDTTLAQSGVVSLYVTGTAQRPTTLLFDKTARYVRVQLVGTDKLTLAEVEVFGCSGVGNCDRIFSFEDYTSEVISTLYGHIFGAIHCGCGPVQVCGICGDGNVDPSYGELCDEGSTCDDGRSCGADPSLCPSECRPRTSQTCTQLCQLPSCGDGVVQSVRGETCDDGNKKEGDGCSSSCLVEFCGDGVVDSNGPDQVLGTSDDEHCDDGNTLSNDGCSSTCKSEFCGDGVVMSGSELCDTGRSCDDGVDCTDNPWICPGQCKTRFTQGCAPDCTYGYCGDLLVDNDGINNVLDDADDEQCDPGKFCPNGIPCSHDESLCPGLCEVTFTPTCTQFCKLTYCGDGYVDLDGVDDLLETVNDNESCDDGNGVDGDGCSLTCQLESTIGCMGDDCETTCGDGTKQFYEPCDSTDGTDENASSCTDICTLSLCGDGIVFSGEQCDTGKWCNDGKTSCTNDPTICPTGPTECQVRYTAGCTEECMLGCGDGTLQPNGRDGIAGNQDDELCDDGNTRQTDSCTNECKRPTCGDGIITYYAQLPSLSGGTEVYYETCDDGNMQDGDDCPSTCIGSGDAVTGLCSAQITPYTLYDITNFTFDDITQFCESGIPDGSPVYDEQTKERSRICHGVMGGVDSICTLPSWSCGDGVVDFWTDSQNGKNVAEACDDGNMEDGDGCTALCQIESPLVFAEDGSCSSIYYPTINMTELLPIWREATVAENFTGTCSEATTNTLIDKENMRCIFAISHGNTQGYTEQVGSFETSCLTDFSSMTGGLLIRDAILDQEGDLDQILGGAYIASGQIAQRATTSGAIQYGQYRLDLKEIVFPYCSLTRTNNAGSTDIITSREIQERTFSSSSLCRGKWSLLPGYLMQQQVLFSEQPNTGLDLGITNLSGERLYLADSSYDQSESIVKYTGPEKSYLFDEIIEKYQPLAAEVYTIATPNDSSTTFKKVPNSHVYIYTEQHDLMLEWSQIEYLLMQAGVPSTKTTVTPFTIIVPDTRAEVHLIGDIPGRGMYVANASIRFIAQDCDENDNVQGLFVTNKGFYTTATINDNPDALSRCNRGSLSIEGLLLGGDIATTLSNVRRSVLNLRDNESQRYADDGNKSYLADQYYRMCVEMPLVHDAYAKFFTTSNLLGGPLSGCTVENALEYIQLREDIEKKLFATILGLDGFFARALNEQNTPVATTFLKLLQEVLLPGGNNGTVTATGTSIYVFLYGDSAYTIKIPSRKMQQIETLGKTLPSFWGSTIDLNDTSIRTEFLSRLRGIIGPVHMMMKQVEHPLEGTPSLHQLLENQWGNEYTQALVSAIQGTSNEYCTTSFHGSDNRLYTNQKDCLLTYTPLYRRMIASMSEFKEKKLQKDEQILDGASVQVRSAPFLRQSPPPGARDLLQAMKISF